MSERQIRRELTHAIDDLHHVAYPDQVVNWQDAIRCAAEHIERAHKAIQTLIAGWQSVDLKNAGSKRGG